jgi:succinate dehydrogenase / fumarate reductase cytochrome b subunit
MGKKLVMAASGLVLFGFVLVHMLGNLKLYLGAEALNHYAEWLRVMGAPMLPREGGLWLARGVLIVAVLLHIWSAWSLTRQSQAARPIAYAKKEHVAADYAARTMRWGGVILVFFIVYHLLHLTLGRVGLGYVPGDAYHNVVAGFRNLWVSGFYVIAQVCLGFHLYHGLWSMFQTLGLSHGRFNPLRRRFAVAFAVLVSLGNISFPLAVLAGVVK